MSLKYSSVVRERGGRGKSHAAALLERGVTRSDSDPASERHNNDVAVGHVWQHLTSIRFSRNKESASPENLDVSVSLIPPVLIHDHMYFLDCINYVFVGVMNAPPLIGTLGERERERVVNRWIWPSCHPHRRSDCGLWRFRAVDAVWLKEKNT